MLLRRASVIIMMCWTMTAQVKAKEYPNNILDYLSMANGNCDTRSQIQAGGVGYDVMDVRLIPVNIPALSPLPVLYLEEAINGTIHALNLCVLTEGKNNQIYLTRYNLTGSSQYKPGQLNPATLSNLTLEDLQGDTNCFAAIDRIAVDVFVANWKDCTSTINGKRPSYSVTYTCKIWAVSVDLNMTERPGLLPYECLHVPGSRYPLNTTIPDGYVSPCDSKKAGLQP